MNLRDLGIDIGVEIDESPLADINREVDEFLDLLQDIDIGGFEELERETRILAREFGDFDSVIHEVDSSLGDIDGDGIRDVTGETHTASKAFDGLKVGAISAITAIGAAIGGLAMSIGMFAMETDEAFARLEAQTGATGAELAVLEAAADEVFIRGYGENIQEVTEALSRVEQNMHKLNDADLADATASAMLLADVLDSDVNEITRGAQGLMEAFGISADKAFDLFTKGGHSGLNLSNDMFDQMSEFAPVAKQAGYSVEELFGLMQRGAENSVYNLDRINNSILEFGILTTEVGNETVADAFGMLSKSTQNLWKDMKNGEATSKELSTVVINELKAMDNQTLANQIGADLWGSVWGDNTQAVMYSMFETTGAMTDFEGAAQSAADAVEETFRGRMLSAWRELQDGIADVVDSPAAQQFFDDIVTSAEELVPIIITSSEAIFNFGLEVVGALDGATESVVGFVAEYDWLIAGIAGSVGTYYLISGAIGVYNAALLFAAGTGPIYTAVTTGMTVATTAFGTAMAFVLSPIGAIVIGIGAAIAIGVLLWKNWDVVMAKLDIFDEWISIKFTGIKESITGALQPAINLFDNLMGKWDSFKAKVSNFSIGGAVEKVASFIPGFDTGLGRVPYDDMPALLHKDEAVIQAPEANVLRDAGVLKGDGRHPTVEVPHYKSPVMSLQQSSQTSMVTHQQQQSKTIQAPITINIQASEKPQETAQAIKAFLEQYFEDLDIIMEG